MKNLGKKIRNTHESIESYSISCQSCSCAAGCGCSCNAISNNYATVYSSPRNEVSQVDYAHDIYWSSK